ncbi:aminoglycoside phosphotransferase [Gryllotalpicola protaetiae]|uniref:Aminoglycoside phosphotransferase n=1 Tax=Gryllotalpicola protaetiae TaxID=2419771 RepID=A0A387BRE0_9MICO|nr:aminoglycoside phosphotransferase [Gryllotalpicola protaetiae]
MLPDGLVVRSARPVAGGSANPVWWCELDDGREVVVKVARETQPDLSEIEAEGLAALSAQGGLATPRVVTFSPRALVLEAVGTGELPPGDARFWADAGRAVARLHAVRSERFGWQRDGWLGRFRQRNTWDADGHRFFAENRILSFLDKPGAEAALDADDRAGLERVCAKLRELVPDTGASLTHGDLWRNNLIAGNAGEPVFIDPAVSYVWPEVDVAMMLFEGDVPDSFFAAYQELRPLHPDWREHARILHLREWLSMVATFGPDPERVPKIRAVIRDYA